MALVHTRLSASIASSSTQAYFFWTHFRSCGKIWEYVKWPTNLQRCSVSELNDHNIIHADNLDYVHVI